MTFFKKYMALVVGGGIALLLAIVVLVLLIMFSGGYAQIQDDLAANQRELERLTRLATFPSVENVDRLTSNLEELEEFRDELLLTISANQPLIPEMERVAFPPELERTWQRLRSMAAENEVVIPADLRFGFERYAAGNLPLQIHVPRLLSQLYSVDRIGEILIDSGIAELRSVERDVFEEQRAPVEREATAAGRRRAPAEQAPVETATRSTAPEPEGVEGLYTRERFTLTFLATEQALFQALNRISDDPVLMIVRNLELRNEMGLGGVSAAARLSSRLQPREGMRPAETRPDDASRSAMREDRVVAGRERIQTRMVVDVYRLDFQHHEEEEIE